MKTSRPRIRRTPEQWRQILDEFNASGLDRKSFCERRGLRREALRRAELRLGLDAPRSMPFVEVSASPAEPVPGWDVELELGDGLVLRLARR